MDTEQNQDNNCKEEPKKVAVKFKRRTKEDQLKNSPANKVKRQATQAQLNHPLHGVKRVEILERLVEYYGWKYLADEVNILCFKHNPTIKVSLKFLTKFQWAREHVEDLYIDMIREKSYQKRKRK